MRCVDFNSCHMLVCIDYFNKPWALHSHWMCRFQYLACVHSNKSRAGNSQNTACSLQLTACHCIIKDLLLPLQTGTITYHYKTVLSLVAAKGLINCHCKRAVSHFSAPEGIMCHIWHCKIALPLVRILSSVIVRFNFSFHYKTTLSL